MVRADRACAALLVALLAGPAAAGPPYLSDDPMPTPYREYEIYLFAAAERGAGGSGGAFGVDFNHGAAPNLQLTAVLPLAWERPAGAGTVRGVGNAELAAKYRFLDGKGQGWSAAVFPRLFLRSASGDVGNGHASVLLPLWLQWDSDALSTFGGGGCTLGHGGGARNFCGVSWAVTRRLVPSVSLGAELAHQTPDAEGAQPATVAGMGLVWDAGDHLHVLAYANRGLQHLRDNPRAAAYAALLFTF